MPGVNVMNCMFLWHNVRIAEEDLIPLIKAKAGCGNFQINLKDKLDEARRVMASNPNTRVELRDRVEEPKVSAISPTPTVEKVVVLEDTTTDSASESSHGGEKVISSAKFTAFVNGNQHTKRLLHSDHTEPSIRKGIITCACEFLFQECGEYASVSDRTEMVKVVVDVFRGLELQEQFVTKWLHMKIKNNRRKAKMADLEALETTLKKRKTEPEEAQDYSQLEPPDYNQLQFLKKCVEVVDVDSVKYALKVTLNIRLDEYMREDFSVFDTYRFFTRCPELVGFWSHGFYPSFQ